MRRAVGLSLAAIIAFAVVLIVRFPARWGAAALPDDITCAHVAGTVWNGTCTGLTTRGTHAGNLTWRLHPVALFTGKLAADFTLMRAGGFARGLVETTASGSSLTLRNLQASLPLDRALIPQLPPNLAGSARADLGLVHVENGIVTALQGRVEASDLVRGGSDRMPLGSYTVVFPATQAGAMPVGHLASTGDGPLDVEGTLRLTREPGFSLEGLVAARPGAPKALQQQLQYLGPANAAGKRPFSVSGTF